MANPGRVIAKIFWRTHKELEKEKKRDLKLQERGVKVLKFGEMPQNMQKLVSEIHSARKEKAAVTGVVSPLASLVYFGRTNATSPVASVEAATLAGIVLASHKVASVGVRKRMAKLETHTEKPEFRDYRKGRDIFIVYGKDIHFIPASRLKFAIAKAQHTFLKHFIPYRYIGMLKSKKFSSYQYEPKKNKNTIPFGALSRNGRELVDEIHATKKEKLNLVKSGWYMQSFPELYAWLSRHSIDAHEELQKELANPIYRNRIKPGQMFGS